MQQAVAFADLALELVQVGDVFGVPAAQQDDDVGIPGQVVRRARMGVVPTPEPTSRTFRDCLASAVKTP
ncbi:hypothetical protein [Streptomyces avermitilis]|uniref:hypothetical protein n=1 Tax=Streptomyces avermitilis TaxID=33903 RepID=UPI0038226A81